MQKLLFLFSILVIISCSDIKKVSEETSGQNPNDQFFGADISEGNSQSLAVLQDLVNSEELVSGKFEITIDKVCQNKGCWMTTKLPDGREIRVTFKDYGFFVPKDAAGKTAFIEGIASKKITPVDVLKHYAEESGKTAEEIEAIVEDKEEIQFVANGVIISQ